LPIPAEDVTVKLSGSMSPVTHLDPYCGKRFNLTVIGHVFIGYIGAVEELGAHWQIC